MSTKLIALSFVFAALAIWVGFALSDKTPVAPIAAQVETSEAENQETAESEGEEDSAESNAEENAEAGEEAEQESDSSDESEEPSP